MKIKLGNFRTVFLKNFYLISFIYSISFVLSGCFPLDEMQSFTQTPALSKIENPYALGIDEVNLPVHVNEASKPKIGSLWREGAKAFFKDQRAAKKGDLLLVNINMKNIANWYDSSEMKRDSKVSATLENFVKKFNPITSSFPPNPVIFDPANAIKSATKPQTKGEGKITHNFTINGMKVPAIVIQVLPNGLMLVFGSREMRFNRSKERIVVMGIANPANITADNIIEFERLAEARFIKAGQGDIDDVIRTPFLQEFVNKFWPL